MTTRLAHLASCRWQDALPVILPIITAAAGGAAWLAGGTSLLGPLLSLLLPAATTISRSRKQAWLAALVYYLIGSVSITSAIAGYYGAGHAWLGLLAWTGSSAALALPWMFGRSAVGRLFALTVTALGVIGWLSPLNAAGVLYPDTGWAGLTVTVILIAQLRTILLDVPDWLTRANTHTAEIFAGVLVIAAIAFPIAVANQLNSWNITQTPANWIGLQTRIPPAQGNLMQDIDNRQALIDAALQQGRHASVVVFPEAMLDDWWDGTQQQLATVVPAGQTWIIGAQIDPSLQPGKHVPNNEPGGKRINAVVSALQNHAEPLALTAASALLLGGNWTPWNHQGLQTVPLQHTFDVRGQKVWASLCSEQLQPWTWLLAMSQKPTLILAMSNGWWASQGNHATRIQIASTQAWARLMNLPVIWAANLAAP